MNKLTNNREATAAVSAGAKELDIVINHPLLHSSHPEFNIAYPSIYSSLSSVRNACASLGVLLKVILETSQLSAEEIVAGSVLAVAAGADFIKTSTGFLGRGASIDDVHIMASIASHPSILDLRAEEWKSRQVKVKASGGVRSNADLMKMVEAGASRIGTSAGVVIMTEGQDAGLTDKGADGY